MNAKKARDSLIDALQEILPHVRGVSTADIMMAYAVMIKSTLISMELTEVEKVQAKVLFDQFYSQALVDQMMTIGPISRAIH